MIGKPDSDELRKEMRRLEGIISDLQGRKSKPEDSEAYFRGILEAFDGFVYVCSSDNRIEFVNKKVIEHIGRDVTGELCHKAVYNLDSLCPWCEEQPVFDGETVRYESRNIRNGRWYHNIVTPIRQSDGSKTKLSICVDITKQREAEEAVRESDRKLKTLMNNLPGMAFRCRADETYSMEFASQGSLKLLGFEPHQLLGTAENPNSFQNIVNPEDRPKMLRQVLICVAERRPFSLIYRVRTASGEEKWVLEQGEGVLSDDGKFVALEGFITDVTAQKEVELDLREENRRLRSSIKDRYKFGNIIGKSRPMQEVYELILRAAATDASVFIDGESGTGKELVAHAIHDLSSRSKGAFVPINCGAVPESLLEREFFGHRKGAFTGANADTSGYLDIADGGTLFLDEVGEIGLSMQVKLLRAIEGRGYTPVGGNEVKKSNFRIVAATNRNLVQLVRDGKMREDFFYRIHILPISLPPLRDRKDDIPLLLDHFMEQHYGDGEKPQLPSEVWEAFQSYNWPGNVRELQNVLYTYVTLGRLDFMGKIKGSFEPAASSSLYDTPADVEGLREAVDTFEKKFILHTLEKTRWHRGRAASILKLDRRTLHRKMEAYRIK